MKHLPVNHGEQREKCRFSGQQGQRAKYHTALLLVLVTGGILLYLMLFSPGSPERVKELESQRVYLIQTGASRVLFSFSPLSTDGGQAYVSYQWRYRQGQKKQPPGNATASLPLGASGELVVGPMRLLVQPVPPQRLKLDNLMPPGQVNLLPVKFIQYAPFEIVETAPAWDLTNPRLRRLLFDLRYGDFVPPRVKQILTPLTRIGLPLVASIATILGLAGLFGYYRGLSRIYPQKSTRHQGVSALLLLLGIGCGWLWQYDDVVHLQALALACVSLVLLAVAFSIHQVKRRPK